MKRIVSVPTLVPSAAAVDSAAEIAFYWDVALRLWKARGASFPGCHPRSIGRAVLPRLHAVSHRVSLKSDGVRYALMLTVRPGTHDVPVALMMDRAKAMYEVDVLATEDHFRHGTLLEGELVSSTVTPDARTMTFLVFDVVCVKGVPVRHRSFQERLQIVYDLTRCSDEIADEESSEEQEDRVRETDSLALLQFEPSVRMRPKAFVDQKFAAHLWSERSNAGHRVDGLIVQQSDAAYGVGVWKWKSHATLDLIPDDGDVVATADGVLTTILGRKVVVHHDARVLRPPPGVPIEYLVEVCEREVHLHALRGRLDKGEANSKHVVDATVQDVLDAVTPDEL